MYGKPVRRSYLDYFAPMGDSAGKLEDITDGLRKYSLVSLGFATDCLFNTKSLSPRCYKGIIGLRVVDGIESSAGLFDMGRLPLVVMIACRSACPTYGSSP